MKVVIVGSGGREHALGWKVCGEKEEVQVHFLPGNGGTSKIGTNQAIAQTDLDGIVSFAKEISPELVIVGPEDPLAQGLVNRLTKAGVRTFGPTMECAQIESSKAFAKHLMSKYSIPTAPYEVFDDADRAHRYVESSSKPLVVKADGLAKGKGSIVANTPDQAHRAIELIMEEKAFGKAGEKVVIEERLYGEEASVLAITDGEHYVVLPPSQDHKPVFDGNKGPNTGGMGAYCPAPVVDDAVLENVERTIFKRLLKGLAKEGLSYRGVIYAGLMINEEGAFVIEFNARFGDPETQAILPVVDVDLTDLLVKASEGRLKQSRIVRASRWAVCVVLASKGYPGRYEKGKEITGLENIPKDRSVIIFHAGTSLKDGKLVTSGGRVLGVTGWGSTLREARREAYDAARLIDFDGKHMRTDIAVKGLERLERTGVI